MKRLPKTPSKLLRLAVKDLESAEQSSSYEIDMHRWHGSNWPDPCAVCFAGAVMAFSLGANIAESIMPMTFGRTNNNKLLALNRFRMYEVFDALDYLGLKSKNLKRYSSLKKIDYQYDAAGFKKQMLKIADRLEEEGL